MYVRNGTGTTLLYNGELSRIMYQTYGNWDNNFFYKQVDNLFILTTVPVTESELYNIHQREIKLC